ncbi:MAG: radical SAM protein [Phycisphaeraceae bacterium]|nr:radical SAM protein [Phycisphaeraceae bacterium]
MLGIVVTEFRNLPVGGVPRGRGAGLNPANRFDPIHLDVLGEHLDEQRIDPASGRPVRTEVYRDATRTLINRVDPATSAEIGFRWSINPYRGCEHGCSYCYARPTHETFGLSCGLDFETRIFAKTGAPALLRRELGRSGWRGEKIMMSGVTDCYQPIESRLRLTRGCLEVMAECRQPVGLVTKNRLVLRDLDVLTRLAAHRAVWVALSVTTLDRGLAARMEPRASCPSDRLEAVRRLADAGIPVSVMVAPVIPGLNDREIPDILAAAAAAGAKAASKVLLRLPWQVKDVFVQWLKRHHPDRAQRVIALIRETRDGRLYDATIGRRLRGTGTVARQIDDMFRLFARRHGLDRKPEDPSGEAFQRPERPGQMRLF